MTTRHKVQPLPAPPSEAHLVAARQHAKRLFLDVVVARLAALQLLHQVLQHLDRSLRAARLCQRETTQLPQALHTTDGPRVQLLVVAVIVIELVT